MFTPPFFEVKNGDPIANEASGHSQRLYFLLGDVALKILKIQSLTLLWANLLWISEKVVGSLSDVFFFGWRCVAFRDLPHPKPLDYTYLTPKENQNRASPQMFGKKDIYEGLVLSDLMGPNMRRCGI